VSTQAVKKLKPAAVKSFALIFYRVVAGGQISPSGELVAIEKRAEQARDYFFLRIGAIIF
jgi:hypothetical protein